MKDKIVAINYADAKFKNAQKLNSKTALSHGADRIIEYSASDIDDVFYRKNKDILIQKRGGGYWLWKPYIIKKTLEVMERERYLIYSDSGAFYINDIELLVRCMQQENQDIMVFTLPEGYLEKIWSKRDAFVLMDCDSDKFYNTPQRLAGFLLLKNTVHAYNFISEWLCYSQDPRILTDQMNCMGRENYFGFRENRHDQTVLSLLSKKYDLKAFRDPSLVLSDNPDEILDRSGYPRIFDLHRMPSVLSVEEVERIRGEKSGLLLKHWEEGKRIVLYGAGKNAEIILSFIKPKGFRVDACVVSDSQIIRESVLCGVSVCHFSELKYEKSEIKILVTTYFTEIYKILEKSGYAYETVDAETIKIIASVL